MFAVKAYFNLTKVTWQYGVRYGVLRTPYSYSKRGNICNSVHISLPVLQDTYSYVYTRLFDAEDEEPTEFQEVVESTNDNHSTSSSTNQTSSTNNNNTEEPSISGNQQVSASSSDNKQVPPAEADESQQVLSGASADSAADSNKKTPKKVRIPAIRVQCMHAVLQ